MQAAFDILEIRPLKFSGGPAGAQPMRILPLSLLVFASSASAQSPPSVDCNAVKNSIVPVELAYHSQNGATTIVQAYRDKSGNYITWSRQTPPSTPPNPAVFVTKTTYISGIIASTEASTSMAGKYSHVTTKYTVDGFPKNFDRRSDATFKLHMATTLGDNTTDEKTATVLYKFKSEEKAVVGSCVLQAIHGETDTTNDAGRTTHLLQIYYPELQISAAGAGAEPVMNGVSTIFSEIKPVN